MGMKRRGTSLASIALALLALAAPGALAAANPPALVLDPSFGAGGVLRLPKEEGDSIPRGVATPQGYAVSGAGGVRELTDAGEPVRAFGEAGVLRPTAPQKGSFALDGLAV